MERGARWAVVASAFVAAASLAAPVARADSLAVIFNDQAPEQSIVALPSSGAIRATTDDAGGVRVEYWVPGSGQSFMTFWPPYGQTLTTGVYDDAHEGSSTGHPGLDPEHCSQGADGRFEVRDLVRDSSGAVTRLWILWEEHCDRYPYNVFGEVRIDEPTAAGAAQPVPGAVRWPALDFGRRQIAVPVKLYPRDAPVSFGAASLTGDSPQEFAITGDECAGATVAAGDYCRVLVRATPAGPGTRLAHLLVPESGGAVHDVPLQSYTYGGTTRVTLHSPPGEPIGDGQDWSFDPSNAFINAIGTPGYVRVGVSATTDFEGDFQAAGGGLRTGRSYKDVAGGTDPNNPDRTAMEVWGNGSTCGGGGDFTVDDATYDAEDQLTGFSGTFDQRCQKPGGGMYPDLTGNFSWRANNTTPPAPWMSGGPPLPASAFAAADAGAGAFGTASPGGGSATPQAASGAPAPSRRASRARLAGACGAARFARAGRRRGTARADQLTGGRGRDVLLGLGGNDHLAGGRGGDCLDGGPGRDVLSGGSGDDVLVGGTGRDRLRCGPGRDVAYVTRGDRTSGCERVRRAR